MDLWHALLILSLFLVPIHAQAKATIPVRERIRLDGIMIFIGSAIFWDAFIKNLLLVFLLAAVEKFLLPSSFDDGRFLEKNFITKWGIELPAIVGLIWIFHFYFAKLQAMYWGWRQGATTRRGAIMAEPKDTRELRGIAQKHKRKITTFAGLPVPVADEVKHFKIVGTTGQGKSTIIREMIDTALACGDRVICADPDGGYLSTFYDQARGDIILNPFDARSARWSVLEELDSVPDVQMLAESLVPIRSPGANNDEWRGYARTFIAALLLRCKQEGGTAQEFYDLAVAAPVEYLAELLDGTPAAPFLSGPNARMFGSIRAVTTSALSSLQYAQAGAGFSFSVRRFIREDEGCLWLPYQATQIASLRDLISTWMRLSMIETMAQESNNADQRIWFIIDELDALGAIAGLKDSAVRIRRFEGRVVIAFQSIAQVRAVYGEEDAATIVENMSTTAILRCSASEGGGTAKFASDLIGEREESRFTMNIGSLGETSLHQQIDTNSLVMPSQIEQLPIGTGYVKLASDPQWHMVNFPDYTLPKVAECFVPRRFGFSDGGGRLRVKEDQHVNAVGHQNAEIIRMPARAAGSDIRGEHAEDS